MASLGPAQIGLLTSEGISLHLLSARQISPLCASVAGEIEFVTRKYYFCFQMNALGGGAQKLTLSSFLVTALKRKKETHHTTE